MKVKGTMLSIHGEVLKKRIVNFVMEKGIQKMTIKNKYLVIDTETTGTNPHLCRLLGIAINDGGSISYGTVLPDSKNKIIIGQNYKYDHIVLINAGYTPPRLSFDTMIAHYLLYINKSHKLENIVEHLFGIHKKDLVEVYNLSTGEERVNLPEDWYNKIDKQLLIKYAMEDVEYTYKIYEQLYKELNENPTLSSWFYSVEMPLSYIITEMELKGVKLDRQGLTNIKEELQTKIPVLENKLKHIAGDKELNLNSSKQLRKILYSDLKLPVLAKTDKGEPSTDKATLTQLASKCQHAFPILLSQYRDYNKILTTYTDSLLDKLDEDDRLHTTYNQALTNTRRFSSDNPNLQNIPTRSEYGKRIKACFIPEKGYKFLVADYSQLEPRILAHLSNDKWLIDRFKNGDDIYEYTKEIVLSSGFSGFNRDRSKILFLALMYGKSSYGLAQDWHCTEEEADKIIQAVYKQLSGVQEYIREVQERAFKTGGWLESLAGLPLYVGNPQSNNKWECSAVDRCAVNYPIQASSQDILKKAIVNIYSKYSYIPVLMIHDELVYEIHESETKEYKPYINSIQKDIINEMENAWKLKVPLKVEYKITDKWEK